MNQMISFCGLLCNQCDAFIATKADDNKKRGQVAQMWAEKYNVNIKPENINCDGCISDSNRHIGHCNVCEIRKCGKSWSILNCAHCDQYPCEKLMAFLKVVPDAKTRLDEVKKGL